MTSKELTMSPPQPINIRLDNRIMHGPGGASDELDIGYSTQQDLGSLFLVHAETQEPALEGPAQNRLRDCAGDGQPDGCGYVLGKVHERDGGRQVGWIDDELEGDEDGALRHAASEAAVGLLVSDQRG